MATIQIERIKEKKSWVHCWTCGADDNEAADWLIHVEEFSNKHHRRKIVVAICDDCLRQVGEALVAVPA